MCEQPTVSAQALSALTSSIDDIARGVAHVKTVFRPAPRGSVSGRSVFYATTAPSAVGEGIKAHVEGTYGAHIVGMSHNLADRPALERDLAQAEGSYEVLVTELKAAAVDVATRVALAAGREVVFADNLPVAIEGDLDAEIVRVLDAARRSFAGHADERSR